MADRLIDFDAARKERRSEPLRLLAFGKTFDLPPAIPAAVVLDAMYLRGRSGKDADVASDDALLLLRRLIPETILDELCAEPEFDLEDLTDLLEMILQAYDMGEAGAPNRSERRQQARGSRAPSNAARQPSRSSTTGS